MLNPNPLDVIFHDENLNSKLLSNESLRRFHVRARAAADKLRPKIALLIAHQVVIDALAQSAGR